MDRENEWHIEGEDATQIVSTAYDAIARMLSLLAEEDRKTADLLNQMANANPGEQARPTVADSPGDFGRVDSIDSTVVYAEVTEIYKAGCVKLPAAAAEYDQARDDLYRYGLPESVNIAFPFSVRPYRDARSNLSAALVSAHESLLDAGASLMQIANTYEWSDSESADQFTLYKEGVEPPPQPYHPHQRPTRGVF